MSMRRQMPADFRVAESRLHPATAPQRDVASPLGIKSRYRARIRIVTWFFSSHGFPVGGLVATRKQPVPPSRTGRAGGGGFAGATIC